MYYFCQRRYFGRNGPEIVTRRMGKTERALGLVPRILLLKCSTNGMKAPM